MTAPRETHTPGFTPGPWNYDEFIFAENGLRIADPYCEGQDEMTEDEVDANARLIAAAPELLEACKACLGLDGYDETIGKVMAMEAIKKAEGNT